jgi:hypothetical protein
VNHLCCAIRFTAKDAKCAKREEIFRLCPSQAAHELILKSRAKRFRHSRGGGNPARQRNALFWIPAFAGMTAQFFASLFKPKACSAPQDDDSLAPSSFIHKLLKILCVSVPQRKKEK